MDYLFKVSRCQVLSQKFCLLSRHRLCQCKLLRFLWCKTNVPLCVAIHSLADLHKEYFKKLTENGIKRSYFGTVFKKMINFILFERQRHTARQADCTHWFTPQMLSTARAAAGWSRELSPGLSRGWWLGVSHSGWAGSVTYTQTAPSGMSVLKCILITTPNACHWCGNFWNLCVVSFLCFFIIPIIYKLHGIFLFADCWYPIEWFLFP